MSKQLSFPVLDQIQKIEKLRNSQVIVLAASNLELEILPSLYQQLLNMGKVDRLDVVLHGRGGVVNAARRIALLLRKFTNHLCFIVPYYCESSATILTLAADEIIAGELAVFTPIDPHLQGEGHSEHATPSALSCLDIKMFGEMSKSWFGVDAKEASEQSLSLLCNNIFPPTLTAFYRTTIELQKIAEELINFQLPQSDQLTKTTIVNHLMCNYYSHNYAITRDEMKGLGLKINSAPEVELFAWNISQVIQYRIGAALRESDDEPWYDALIATKSSIMFRKNRIDGLMPCWIEGHYS